MGRTVCHLCRSSSIIQPISIQTPHHMVKLLEPLRMGYMIHLGAKMRHDAIVTGSIVDLLLAR